MLLQYETSRLILKVLKSDSAPLVVDFYNRDKELFEKYEIDRIGDFYSTRYQQKVLKYEYNMAVKSSMIRYYVFLKDNPSKIIGTVCLHNIAANFYGCCEIGYKFSSEVHHRGYATEALTKVLEVIFYELQLHRVQAWVLPDNAPSIRLLERVGFVFEGISRDYLFLHGTWQSHALYSILPSDLQVSSGHNQ